MYEAARLPLMVSRLQGLRHDMAEILQRLK